MKQQSPDSFLRIAIKAAVIVIASSILAAVVTLIRPGGMELITSGFAGQTEGKAGKPDAPAVRGVKNIDLIETKAQFDGKKALFIDARSIAEYMSGHIPGSKNLPYDKFEDYFLKILGSTASSSPLVVYCSGDGCNSSVILAQKLVEEGFTNVMVFYGGWPEWEKAGYPSEKGGDNPLGGLGF